MGDNIDTQAFRCQRATESLFCCNYDGKEMALTQFW